MPGNLYFDISQSIWKNDYEGFGCQIYERGNKVFVMFDSGGVASRLEESELTKQEVEIFKRSAKDAYDVLLKAQQRDRTKIKSSF